MHQSCLVLLSTSELYSMPYGLLHVRRVDVWIAAVEPSFAIGLIVGVAVGVAVLEVLD